MTFIKQALQFATRRSSALFQLECRQREQGRRKAVSIQWHLYFSQSHIDLHHTAIWYCSQASLISYYIQGFFLNNLQLIAFFTSPQVNNLTINRICCYTFSFTPGLNDPLVFQHVLIFSCFDNNLSASSINKLPHFLLIWIIKTLIQVGPQK